MIFKVASHPPRPRPEPETRPSLSQSTPATPQSDAMQPQSRFNLTHAITVLDPGASAPKANSTITTADLISFSDEEPEGTSNILRRHYTHNNLPIWLRW